MGPVGSGKTSSCVMEIFTRAQEQAPDETNTRRTRWAVVRNTFPQLKSTTIRTFQDWFPVEAFGTPKMDSPITHELNTRLHDGTTLQAEIIFIALDGVDAEAKLKSLEVTGAFINEASEIQLGVFELLTSRVGRFPAIRDGGCTWSGIIMDTNPPDTDSWIYRIFEEERPETFSIYKQPAGDSDVAENLENLQAGYYERLKAGKKVEWINVFVKGQYGYSFDGKPIFPEYQDATHCKSLILENAPLTIGIDFGLTPAAVIAQEIAGQWRILGELVSKDMGAINFAEQLKLVLSKEFNGVEVGNIWGDPAGVARSQVDERTPFEVLQHAGIHAQPAPTNDVMLRRETVANLLRTLTMTGEPALLLDPKARVLRKAMAGAYCYRRVRVANDERYQDKPDKNDYSHVSDALQYCLMGGGAGELICKVKYPPAETFKVDTSYVV